MSIRLIILLGLGLVLGVLLYAKMSSKPTTPQVVQDDEEDDMDLAPEERMQIRERQKLLAERNLPGREPPEPAELSVRIELDTASGKNRLCVYIAEAHGYYVETFRVGVTFKGRDEITGVEKPLLFVEHYVNKYLKANDTLKECFEVVPAEVAQIGGDMGTIENWDAEIISYGRARLNNPDPLPPL